MVNDAVANDGPARSARPARHSWQERLRTDAETHRVCRRCGLADQWGGWALAEVAA